VNEGARVRAFPLNKECPRYRRENPQAVAAESVPSGRSAVHCSGTMRSSSKSPAHTWKRLLKALSGSSIGFAIYDQGYRYVRVNSAIAVMNGVPPEEHLGQTAPSVIGRASRIIEPRIDRVFLTGRPVYYHEFSAKLPRRTGIGCWIQDYFPLCDEGHRVSHVGIFVVEVTKERRIEAIIRHLRRSVASGVTIDDGHKLRALIRAAQPRTPSVWRKPPSEVPFDSASALELPFDILRNGNWKFSDCWRRVNPTRKWPRP
jgi:PAS domain-containing protein